MPRYAISISLQAERLPDPPERSPEGPLDPGADPGVALVKMAGQMFDKISAQPGSSYVVHRPSGMNAFKNIEISAESFLALAEILSKFDHLAEEIECSNPSKRW
jgi:hypothetical protein